MSTDLNDYFAEVEERFEAAEDFTVGIEEEFQILRPETLELVSGFEELRDAAGPRLGERISGELIRSEIEVRTPRSAHFAEGARELRLNRDELFRLAEAHGYALGATGTHPYSSWRDQELIDTPHYRLVEERLKYVAWRNNTWSIHVHIGIRGKDRAVAVCDGLRGYLPHLLALSANSPFIEGVWTQLHSARAQTFVRMFPRCGVPDAFVDWAEHRSFYETLIETGCIEEFTQVWWSIRPHHGFGTVEVRICDMQTEPWQALAVTALAVGLSADLARAYDERRTSAPEGSRYIEENLWRAIRFGLDGKLVDFAARRELPAADAIRRLVERAAPYADELGIAPHLDGVERLLREGNGAQCQARAHIAGATLEAVYAETVVRARATSLGSGAEREEV
jgi:carboxylate-amine ligase